jgi:CheY-like chemotaxis protein
MEELLNKINNLIDSSIENSSEETQLQLRILKGNIKTLFDEANMNAFTPAVQTVTPVEAPVSVPVMETPVEPAPELNVSEPVNDSVAGIPNFESASLATPAFDNATGKKILIVDDSSIIRNYLEKLCKDKYTTVIAPGGAEAINLLGSDKYDLMLLDLMMPGVDGFGVLDYIKGNNVIVPTIIISGDTTKESIDRAFTYNVVDMIEKPFSEKTIMEKINRILE